MISLREKPEDPNPDSSDDDDPSIPDTPLVTHDGRMYGLLDPAKRSIHQELFRKLANVRGTRGKRIMVMNLDVPSPGGETYCRLMLNFELKDGSVKGVDVTERDEGNRGVKLSTDEVEKLNKLISDANSVAGKSLAQGKPRNRRGNQFVARSRPRKDRPASRSRSYEETLAGTDRRSSAATAVN